LVLVAANRKRVMARVRSPRGNLNLTPDEIASLRSQ